MSTELAHTAEHAFVGSLQKLLGMTLSVRKVEHRKKDSIVIIDSNSLNLDFELIARAQYDVNHLIANGRRVFTYVCSSLSSAKDKFPSIRVNQSRLKAEESVRVVEIERHDIAACIKEHAKDMSECGLFLVTNVSKRSKEYQINFVVGVEAREMALDLSSRIFQISRDLGANLNTIESTIKKLKSEKETYFENLKFLTREKLLGLIPKTIDSSHNISLITGNFTCLLDSEIESYVSQKINRNNTIVIIANKLRSSENDLARIVFARSTSIPVDFCQLVRETVPSARGGGRPEFYACSVNHDEVANAIEVITKVIPKRLAESDDHTM
ncbi:MAG TPA: hypothetical protein VH500_13350 [Nitrososphaeraceae archaeon]|jgi:alanyl-tRNA synthetase